MISLIMLARQMMGKEEMKWLGLNEVEHRNLRDQAKYKQLISVNLPSSEQLRIKKQETKVIMKCFEFHFDNSELYGLILINSIIYS